MSDQQEIADMSAEELRDYYKRLRLNDESISNEERQLLLEKFVLDDGSVVDSYSVYLHKKKWLYICHLCDLSGKNWPNFTSHIYGKQHREMRRNPVNTAERFGIRIIEGPKGRYLRSGVVDDKHTQFSKRTANYDGPLIGSEYLVELVENEATHYICLLCKEEGDFDTVKYHLATPDHCWTYLEMFFPKAVQKINDSQFNEDQKEKLMKHIVAKAEYVYGRIKVSKVEKSSYPPMEQIIFDKIQKGQHLREMPGMDFTDCVDISHLEPEHCPVGWLRRLEENSKGGKKQLQVPPPLSGPPPFTKRRRMALGRKFRNEARAQINNDISYNETFIDNSYYQTTDNKNLDDPLSDSNHPNTKQVEHPNQYMSLGPIPPRPGRDMKDGGPQKNFMSSKRFSEDGGRVNSWSNEERDARPPPLLQRQHQEDRNYPREQSSSSYSSSFQSGTNFSTQGTTIPNEDSGIIPVLRNLSVLETNLGTLGSKAVELLKEAIYLEKCSVGGASVLISREEILLETIKEKLKGLLELRMVDAKLADASKFAIIKIESLLSAQKSQNFHPSETSSFSDGFPSYNEKSEHTYDQNFFNQSSNSSNYNDNNSESSQYYRRRSNNFNQASSNNSGNYSRGLQEGRSRGNNMPIRGFSQDNYRDRYMSNSKPYDTRRFHYRK